MVTSSDVPPWAQPVPGELPSLAGRPLDSPDFALRWPMALFVAEGRLVLEHGDRSMLLGEAFASGVPATLQNQWSNTGFGISESSTHEPFPYLLQHADRLKQAAAPRPYYRQRNRAAERKHVDPLTGDVVALRFVRIVDELWDQGYFQPALYRYCVDDRGDFEDPADVLHEHIEFWRPTWPLDPQELWSEPANLYDVIEVLHDLAARPRTRWYHQFADCGFHYDDHVPSAGQMIYRWRVNELLEQSDLGLRLADDGEDVGRLVSTTDEARTELLQTMARRSDRSTGDRVRHAISMFRSRGATEHEKRSACTALALVLEERRPLLKETLLRKDEGALFQIANEFAIRHEDGKQQRDYRPGFRDWIFWWYLATIELTDRLLSDESGTTGP